MARKNSEKMQVAVLDFETDPFEFERKPFPFAAGFRTEENYVEFVGISDRDDPLYNPLNDCVINLINHIYSLDTPHVIYAHNGGKFDFMFFLEYNVLENPMLIIHGRITKCQMGIHEIRDSYAAMPLPLKKIIDADAGKKGDIDYNKMKRSVRHLHMSEILSYMKQDCDLLYSAIVKFREKFGDKLTVGSAAIAELGKLHTVYRLNKNHDKQFRDFYYGGRVECFEYGECRGDFKIYDVNSMYSYVMKNFNHPLGSNYVKLDHTKHKLFNPRTGRLRDFAGDVYFMRFSGQNRGAIPTRDETGKLNFNIGHGEFNACSHEIIAGCELGLIDVETIHEIWVPCQFQKFDKFVDQWMVEKKAGAREQKGGLRETFAKLILNSAYGKFGTNADEFCEWFIFDSDCDEEELRKFEEWRDSFGSAENTRAVPKFIYERFQIWQAPAPNERGFFDVAVAASITSASRSVLLRAIHSSVRPIYCDTDSLLCVALKNVRIDPLELGAWKCEGRASTFYIAGKKLYSGELENADGTPELDKDGKVKIKLASKGAKLEHDDIVRLTRGEIVEWRSEAPNFKLSGETKFTKRNISRRY